MRSIEFRILSVALVAGLALFVTPTKAFAVIQNLNSQTGQTQTFQNDPNLTISSSNNIHSLIWQGQLPVSRGGTGASSFTAGSLLFSNGTSISQDNSNLFWDDTNKRLRLGSDSYPGSIFTPDASNPNTNGVILEISTGDGLGSGNGANLSLGAGNGGLVSGDGGAIYLTAGSAQGMNSGGGDIFLITGDGSGSVVAGSINVFAGNANGTANGGDFQVQLGAGGLTSGNGGEFHLTAGSARGGNSNGGDFLFEAGQKNGSGRNGLFLFEDGGTHNRAILDTGSLLGSRTFTFPNASGTFGLLEANQTWNGLNTFEASTNSTIYVGSSVKSGCIALGDSDGSGITYITANDGVLSASSTKPSICQ